MGKFEQLFEKTMRKMKPSIRRPKLMKGKKLNESEDIPTMDEIIKSFGLKLNKSTGRYDGDHVEVGYDESLGSTEGVLIDKNGQFTIKFGHLGSFNCYDCPHLTSLKNGPTEVDGDFNINGCESLKSLDGAPKHVGGDVYAIDCGFTEEEIAEKIEVRGTITV